MRVPRDILNNVSFIGYEEDGVFKPMGTGFVVVLTIGQKYFAYLVTAKHVVAGTNARGHTIKVRMNREEGGSDINAAPFERWQLHPVADVAAVPVNMKGYRWLPMDTSRFLTPAKLAELEFGFGDEVVAVGLFRNHHGQDENSPIVRVGSLAAIPQEPVYTAHMGRLEAYLVELHSIGGLSGSPVFLHHAPLKYENQQLLAAQPEQRLFLLGLVHGHFDVKDEDKVVDEAAKTEGPINTGIGVVTPAHFIFDLLNSEEFANERNEKLAAQ